ncbi:hypothetical protein CDAR_164291 [Caerostris darwini]|uniref:Uncharacterized protein n=1 Tax=Caerostris darwini TaxID=1538125 RepID=A0AAV4X773_9ARAC|nr:hypothetical protein CDAR_164291 [Caerostris darwini]
MKLSDDEDCDRNSHGEPGNCGRGGNEVIFSRSSSGFPSVSSLGHGNVRDPVAISPAIYEKGGAASDDSPPIQGTLTNKETLSASSVATDSDGIEATPTRHPAINLSAVSAALSQLLHVAIFSLEINTRTDRAAKITKGNETSGDEDCDRNSNGEPGKVEGVGMKSFSPVRAPVFSPKVPSETGMFEILLPFLLQFRGKLLYVAIFSLEINTRTDRAAKITKGNETSGDEDCDRNSNRETWKSGTFEILFPPKVPSRKRECSKSCCHFSCNLWEVVLYAVLSGTVTVLSHSLAKQSLLHF